MNLLIKKILYPEKTNYLIKSYHNSSKILLPGFISYYCFKNIDYVNDIIYSTNIVNITYHSYYSISSVVGDYIKPKKMCKKIRITNFLFHSISFYGYFYKYIK